MPQPYGAANPTTGQDYIFLSTLVNLIRPSQSYLRESLFPSSSEQLLPTEQAEMTEVRAARSMAPFTRPGTPPRPVQGLEYTYDRIATPYISIEREIEMRDAIFTRRPTAGIFHTGTDQMTAATREHLAREFTKLTWMIENREEWQVASMLTTKSMSYTDEAGDAWSAQWRTSASLSGINLAANTYWDSYTLNGTTGVFNEAEVQSTDPSNIAKEIGREMVNLIGVFPDTCIMGADAADAFEKHPHVLKKLDTQNLQVGALNLNNQFSQQGVRLIGIYRGITYWEYSRALTDNEGPNQTDTELIPADTAVFISKSDIAQREMYYGALANIHAISGRQAVYTLSDIQNMRPVQIRRFGDVYVSHDGNTASGIVTTRPMPNVRVADTFHALKVVG